MESGPSNSQVQIEVTEIIADETDLQSGYKVHMIWKDFNPQDTLTVELIKPMIQTAVNHYFVSEEIAKKAVEDLNKDQKADFFVQAAISLPKIQQKASIEETQVPEKELKIMFAGKERTPAEIDEMAIKDWDIYRTGEVGGIPEYKLKSYTFKVENDKIFIGNIEYSPDQFFAWCKEHPLISNAEAIKPLAIAINLKKLKSSKQVFMFEGEERSLEEMEKLANEDETIVINKSGKTPEIQYQSFAIETTEDLSVLVNGKKMSVEEFKQWIQTHSRAAKASNAAMIVEKLMEMKQEQEKKQSNPTIIFENQEYNWLQLQQLMRDDPDLIFTKNQEGQISISMKPYKFEIIEKDLFINGQKIAMSVFENWRNQHSRVKIPQNLIELINKIQKQKMDNISWENIVKKEAKEVKLEIKQIAADKWDINGDIYNYETIKNTPRVVVDGHVFNLDLSQFQVKKMPKVMKISASNGSSTLSTPIGSLKPQPKEQLLTEKDIVMNKKLATHFATQNDLVKQMYRSGLFISDDSTLYTSIVQNQNQVYTTLAGGAKCVFDINNHKGDDYFLLNVDVSDKKCAYLITVFQEFPAKYKGCGVNNEDTLSTINNELLRFKNKMQVPANFWVGANDLTQCKASYKRVSFNDQVYLKRILELQVKLNQESCVFKFVEMNGMWAEVADMQNLSQNCLERLNGQKKLLRI